jgi:hypothetical protein
VIFVARLLLASAAVLTLCGAVRTPAPESTAAGEAIYRDGRLPSGKPLLGQRGNLPPVEGSDIACAQCHRRSGLGMVEGRTVIPPITGRFLFHPGQRLARDSTIHEGETHLLATPPDRPAYDEASLARAIRDGVGANGRPLDTLMPRYDLDDTSLGDLIAYLKRLNAGRIPGVTDSALQFATIVTPDADPAVRDGMLNVLGQYFQEKNSRFIGEIVTPLLHDGRPVQLQTQRYWRLQVWQLQGPPETWEEQLDERQRRQPVFAVISGLGGANWEPVAHFCEHQAVPCLFPNVDLPVVEDGEFYSVYFSQGVLLEAELIAARLKQATDSSQIAPGGTHDPEEGAGRNGGPERTAAQTGRIVQVFRSGDIGAAAAARLRAALPAATPVVDRELSKGNGPRELAQALQEVRASDTVVLWLRPSDLATLPEAAAGLQAVYVSGLMGGLEKAPLAPSWRAVARISYPYALPDERSLRLNYPLGWFRLRRIPVVDERVQVDTYVACSVLLESLATVVDEYVPDYLVERVEMMLDSRIVNGYYTRLGLAQGQRFASKGGYMVRFAASTGTKVVADGPPWTVPD